MSAITDTKLFRGNLIVGRPPETKPIVGLGEGKVRLRFRAMDAARGWIRTKDGIESFLLTDEGDHWGVLKQFGENRNVKMELNVPFTETFPNITWETESNKLFAGDQWQSGSASAIRSCKAMNDLMMEAIKNGADPVERIKAANHWLAACLYSCNMNNFK